MSELEDYQITAYEGSLGDDYSIYLEVRPHPAGGIQKLYTFPNGWGASVGMFKGSYGFEYGLWELAVIDPYGEISYDTPITKDVLGRLDETLVQRVLNEIISLNAA